LLKTGTIFDENFLYFREIGVKKPLVFDTKDIGDIDQMMNAFANKEKLNSVMMRLILFLPQDSAYG